ncbi:hypothetical protein PG993_014073 [Apiospora rasikravindrae]|uniref:Uncharacterized protein n=1 Tax=Apiospora rasikravindrae TaxID=990691 RepID=A0ABR1RS82_9PEZI
MSEPPPETYTTPMAPQPQTSENEASNSGSPASKLCGEAIRLFISIVKHISQSGGPYKAEMQHGSLQRSLDRFRLWDDAYGVSWGEIDYLFRGSRRIYRSISGLLVSISITLVDRLSPLFVEELKTNLTPGGLEPLARKMKGLIENISDGDGQSDSAGDYTDCTPDSIKEIAEDLKADTMGLLELDPLIRHPVLDFETE